MFRDEDSFAIDDRRSRRGMKELGNVFCSGSDLGTLERLVYT